MQKINGLLFNPVCPKNPNKCAVRLLLLVEERDSAFPTFLSFQFQ